MLRGLTITGGTGSVHARGVRGEPSTGGGGLLCRGSSPVIEHCVIHDNIVRGTDSYGGGALCVQSATPIFRACSFRSNSGVRGSALYLRDEGTHVTFEGGLIADECSRIELGSIAYIRDGAALEIRDTKLLRNTCSGGLSAYGGTILADRCVLREWWRRGVSASVSH